MTGGLEQSHLVPLKDIIRLGGRSLLDIANGNFRDCMFDPRDCGHCKKGPNEFAHLCDAPGTDETKVVYCGRENILIAPPPPETSKVDKTIA
jgi:hypothetical protein